MSEDISTELDYTPKISNHSTTIYRSIVPQGSSTVTLSNTSSVGPTEFIIPPSVWRGEKSRLNFQLQLATGGTTNIYHWVNANTTSMISRIVLYDNATNATWFDVSNFEKYTAMVLPAGTSYEEYSTKTLVAAAAMLLGFTTSAGSTPYPVEDICKSNALVNYTGITTADTGLYNDYDIRKQYYIQGAAGGQALYLDVSIPFSAFKFTALATKKLLYCPSNLTLQVYWNKTDNFAFDAALATDASTPASVTTPQLNNMQVLLANEGNLSIVSQVIDRVMNKGGITLPIGYPTVTRQSISSTSTVSYQLQLTKGYGDRILFLATAGFQQVGSTLVYYNQHVRSLNTTYNTFINNVALKYPAGFDCSKGEDFKFANREYLKGSAVQSMSDYYIQEWVHFDSFFGEKPLYMLDQHEIDGLDVGTQSSTWSIQLNTSGAQAPVFITAIVGQKILSITSQGSLVN